MPVGGVVGGHVSRGSCVLGSTFGSPAVMSQCPLAAAHALYSRHLSVPPNRLRRAFPNLLVTALSSHFQAIFPIKLKDQLEGQWRSSKTQGKLRTIDRSWVLDVETNHCGKSFIKREVGIKVMTKTRLIQGHYNEFTSYRHPEEYAAMSKTLQETIVLHYAGIDFILQYAGGLNHDALSDQFSEYWSLAKHPYLHERDGKNWDSTMQEPLLRAELELYQLLGMRASEAFLLRSSNMIGSIATKVGKLRHILKYSIAWKRLSGDWNTSCGNTLISMLITLVVLSELPPGLKPSKVYAWFMGDDYLGIYDYDIPPPPQALLTALNDGEASMGITPVAGIYDDPLRVSFISLGLWPRHEGGFQFVPFPAKQLVKLFHAPKLVHHSNIADYQTALAIAFWPTFWGFPLMQRFLKQHYTRPSTKYNCDLLFDDAPYWCSQFTKRARGVNWVAGFCFKYDIPYAATLFDLPGEFGVYRHPTVERMLEIEALDPDQRPSRLA